MSAPSASRARGDAPDPRPLDELMAAFVAGDAAAFDALFRRMSPRVSCFLRAMCGDARLAEDLTQTTFLKVLRAREQYHLGAPVEPWVFAIARRCLIDDRRMAHRRLVSLTADGALPEPPIEPTDAAWEPLTEEGTATLYASLAALSDGQREALVLLKVQGLSAREAAAVAGTSVSALKVRAHRAYEVLRGALGVRKEKS